MAVREETEKPKTYILLVTFAAQGHLNPMLRFGTRLASKGLHVTLATTEDARAFHPSTTTIAAVNIQFFYDGVPPDYDRKADIDSYMYSLAKFGPTSVSALIQKHSPKFSCIINTPFVPWVADVAATHGIPCGMLFIQPCTLYAIYYRFYNHLNEFPTETNPDMSVELPGLPFLQTEDLPSFILQSNSFHSFTGILTDVFQNMNKLKWVLGNSFNELEKDVIESMNDVCPIWPVGPIVPSALLSEAEELDTGLDLFKSEDTSIEWLNKQKPSSVIYISFGSLLFLAERETEIIATALKNTKRPFLWVIKPPKNSENGLLPFGFLNEINEQGLIVKWCPQIQVLKHSSIGCFLSHCGWNSLLETIVAGVPVIAYPQWTDQPTNAKLVTDVFRVGVRLNRDADGVVSSEEVERCIEEIISGPRAEEFKAQAAELKQAAKEAVADGGSSDRNIQLFVDEIISSSS